MKDRPKISSIEVFQYEKNVLDVGVEPTIGILIYQPGGVQKFRGRGLRINTDLGVSGEYFGGFEADYAVVAGLAHTLIGRNALERDAIYDDLKQATRQQSRMGMGVVDIAPGIWPGSITMRPSMSFSADRPARNSLVTPAPTSVIAKREGSTAPWLTPTSPRRAWSWAIPASRSTAGRTPLSRIRSNWSGPWAGEWVTGWT